MRQTISYNDSPKKTPKGRHYFQCGFLSHAAL